MVKYIIILLLIFVSSCFAQRKMMFIDYDGDYSNGSHDWLTRQSFILGYETGTGLTWDSLREGHFVMGGSVWHYGINETLQNDTNYVLSLRIINGGSLVLGSYSSLYYYWYPRITFVWCPSQTYSGIPTFYNYEHNWTNGLNTVVLAGADWGEDTNTAAYDVEFFDTPDSRWNGNAPSGSISIISGKLMAIADLRNCSIWEARYCARMTTGRSYTNTSGYGRINVMNAVAYNGVIPPNPYVLPLGNIGTIESYYPMYYQDEFTFPSVVGAKYYDIFLDDILWRHSSILNHQTIISLKDESRTFNEYIKLTYRAYNDTDTTEISTPYYWRHKKYKEIIIAR